MMFTFFIILYLLAYLRDCCLTWRIKHVIYSPEKDTKSQTVLSREDVLQLFGSALFFKRTPICFKRRMIVNVGILTGLNQRTN